MVSWTAFRHRWFAYLCAGVLTVGFLGLRIWDPAPLQFLRLKTFDVYQRIHPRPAEPMPVVIADIDEESLKAYGQWPWPRSRVAELVDKLMARQVAAIGFDAIFAEPDRLSPGSVMEAIPGLSAEQRGLLSALPSNDAVFADAIRRGRVVLGQATNADSGPGRDDGPALEKTRFANLGEDPLPYVTPARTLVRNLAELEKSASGIGLLTHVPEGDGVVRRVPLVARVGDRLYPTLTVEMLRVAVDAMMPNVDINTLVIKTHRDGVGGIVIPEFREIPTDDTGRAWVAFGPPDPRRYIPVRRILEGGAGLPDLQGYFVLVGTSAIGLKDINATPVAAAMPGVEVHAQLLETILSERYLKRPSYAFAIELVLLAGLCVLLIASVAGMGPVAGLVAGIVAIGAAFGASWYAYTEHRLLIGVAEAAGAGFVLYTTLTFLNFLRGDAEKRQIRGAFGQYLSPALVEQLARHPEKLRLGGELRDMTILFCDIRGFTAISEQYKDAPEGLTDFINGYLTPLTDVVLANGGTIDKYMGDCIMAFWNAPLDDPDHADHACASSLAMLRAIDELNRKRRAEAEASPGGRFIPIKMGFGLNSGICCVGNMGSVQRFDYSVIGDDVNLASRLEGQSKTYDVSIVAGEGTKERAPGYAWLELDLIRVKGKTDIERIYSLLGDGTLAEDPGFAELAALNAEMLERYRTARFEEARGLATRCRELAERLGLALDGLYAEYLDRIAGLLERPPAADWDPVFAPQQK
jgi:adenylate cyclase